MLQRHLRQTARLRGRSYAKAPAARSMLPHPSLTGSRRLPHAHGREGCRHVHPTSHHEAPCLILCLENRPVPSGSFSTAHGVRPSTNMITLHPSMAAFIPPSARPGLPCLACAARSSTVSQCPAIKLTLGGLPPRLLSPLVAGCRLPCLGVATGKHAVHMASEGCATSGSGVHAAARCGKRVRIKEAARTDKRQKSGNWRGRSSCRVSGRSRGMGGLSATRAAIHPEPRTPLRP